MRSCLRALALAAVVFSAAEAAATISSLSIMTFNVWVGEGTAAGRIKLAEIIQTSGADVVGIQELDNSAGLSIASSLGFYYHQQSGSDIQVMSRYPIVGQSAGNLGVKIEVSPGQQMWLFNSHLAAYPYQPYDLRDSILPQFESAVVAAADAARGSQVTAYLSDMAAALSSNLPVFFTGDFNEPSHLDWTAAAAAATARPFDLKVEYPTSKRIVDAGMVDSWRVVRPDVINDRAYTWTPGTPPPFVDANEVHDRIDIVYHKGDGVVPLSAMTVGYPDGDPNTDLSIPGYNADHRAVVVTYELPCNVLGDFNSDCRLDIGDWSILRSYQLADLSGLTAHEAYQRGDMNGDFLNDHADFAMFKSIFDGQNGVGSFAAMLAAIPEPAGGAMIIMGLFGGAGQLHRRRARRGPQSG